MILAHEKSLLKVQAKQQLDAMVQWIGDASTEQLRIDQVERELFARLMALGHTLLQAFVAGRGNGDAGEQVEQEDGRCLRRLAQPHVRRYVSIFGVLMISRIVYAVREGQKIEHVPLDQLLGLPAGEFSYVLEDWMQRLCVQDSYAGSVDSLTRLLGVAPSVRAAEQMTQRVAGDSETFELNQAPPPMDKEGKILVATADGKGIPMVRPLEERIAGSRPRRSKGEKAHKKQMAYVGAVYSIDPFVRTAEDVVDEVFRRERAADRPVPRHKHVWARMTLPQEGPLMSGRERVFIEMAIACHRRDLPRCKTLVCLMDGERALWELAGQWLERAVGILDLYHVLERLWQAAYCFHREGSVEAAEFVAHRLRLLLQGKVGYVIGGLRRLGTKHRLDTSKRKALNGVITYYSNNRQHMRYDEYLAAGYPIGSGVAEGACRHLVKDRMERTGMRWTPRGAQSLLNLRSVHINGTWDAYMNHHIEHEQARLYGQTAA